VTKARGCKVAGQKGSLGVMLYAPGSARKCEGIGPHTPKGTPILGVRASGGFPNVHRVIAGVKIQWIKKCFIS